MTAMIRPATEADWQALRAVRLQALRDHPTAFGADYETEAAMTEAQWRDRASCDPAWRMTFAAISSETIVGTITAVRSQQLKFQHGAHIYAVYVLPEHRGTGAGDALLEAIIAWADTLQLRQLRLDVSTNNTSAVRLYARHGFTVYGVNPAFIYYDGHYYDELLMIRRLATT